MVVNPNYDSDAEWEMLAAEEEEEDQLLLSAEQETEQDDAADGNESFESAQDDQHQVTEESKEKNENGDEVVKENENTCPEPTESCAPEPTEPCAPEPEPSAPKQSTLEPTEKDISEENEKETKAKESESSVDAVDESVIVSPVNSNDENTPQEEEEQQQQQQDEATPLLKDSDESSGETKNEWACPRCTLLNPMEAEECDACLLKNPSMETDDEGFGLRAFLGASLRQLGSVAKDIDDKHKIRRKTKNSFKTVGSSMRKVGEVIESETKQVANEFSKESQRIGEKVKQEANSLHGSIKDTYVRQDIPGKARAVEEKAKVAAERIKETAQTAGEKVKALNEDGKVTDFLTAAAVIGAGILFAKGNPHAGATVAAAGGAAYMAGEASRAQQYRHDSGLNEDLHME